MNLQRLWSKIGKTEPSSNFQPAAGVRHYLRAENGGKVRLHLRTEPDGHAVLIVNAARIFHFNPSAALMAFCYLEGMPPEKAVASLRSAFNVPSRQASQDYAAFVEQLKELIDPNGGCPVCEMEMETSMPFSDRPSAPYRMDLALTYRCSNDCAHCYNQGPRQRPELDTAHWKEILDRLWSAGIPHIIFTGGEPTLRPDLAELIAHAQQNGQITGINTNGRRLKDTAYLAELVQAGLDHVQITLESHLPDVHDRMVARPGAWQETVAGVRAVLASPLYVMTNTTMLQENTVALAGTLDFLAELGVPTVGLNALIYSGRGAEVGTGLPEASLPPLLNLARQKTEHNGQRLIWYTPTQYCHFDPQSLELGVKGCTAALYNMCIEPDGSVIPCQSYYQPVGQILSDPWESIWNHSLCQSLRDRADLPPECKPCLFLAECGGGCPLARQACRTAQPRTIDPLQVETANTQS